MGAGEDVSFQNTGTTIKIQCLNLDANFSLVSSLHRYKCRPYFGIYLHMLFLSFLMVELFRIVRVCGTSF